MSTRTSAWFVGEGSLLVQCAEAYASAGHTVLGVASSDGAVRRWADKRRVQAVPLAGALEPILAHPFDYLFSIVNLEILDRSIVSAPRILAANFHDGPLPTYAGLNAPVWALLNREAHYGVTWHEMTSTVDAGRILKQQLFDLSDGETAFSLNARCYEAGLRTFTELVEDIGTGRVSLTPQDLTRRTEFKRDDRPVHGCVVSWDVPADQIRALVLALDFGPYPNPFGAARLLTRDGAFLLAAVDVVGSASNADPGTIVEIRPDAVLVATATTPVAIRGVRRMTGEPVAIPQLVSEAGIREGDNLCSVAHGARQAVEAANHNATHHEPYWVRRLAGISPVRVPYFSDRPAGGNATTPRTQLAMDFPEDAIASLVSVHEDRTSVGLALIGLYLARLSGSSTCTVAFTDHDGPHVGANARRLFADCFPVDVALSATSFGHVVSSVEAQRKDARARGAFFLDVLARYPALAQVKSSGRWSGPVIVVSRDPVLDAGCESPAGSALAIVMHPASSSLVWDFDPAIISADQVREMQRQLASVTRKVAADSAATLSSLPLLDAGERERAIVDWNRTDRSYEARCVHELIEDQAARTPDAVAVVFQDGEVTYRELNARANQVARYLRSLGVGPDTPVGVCLERSIELVVSLLGVLKAGGAYVPLDPHYPHDRLTFVVADARLTTVITEERFAASFPTCPHTVALTRDARILEQQDERNLGTVASVADLAYVMYTSGSTGTPKGVMIEHRSVANFIAAMDDYVPRPASATWLAVTSVSFDISVLEIFWTLARGFKVVLSSEDKADRRRSAAADLSDRPLDFSLFYFSADEGSEGQDKYRLLLEGARFADAHSFSAVWTPERHFHAFGGLYPNPSVTSAAVAAVTSKVKIRAGSCVLPLHHPLRVVEEWSVVDNLSGGRVGVSFASGWQPNDFALRPENYADRKAIMLRDIETVRALWRGEPLECVGPNGETSTVRTLPRPVQAELPIWLTAAGNPETFQAAAAMGAGVLTHLVGQSLDELAVKIAAYRSAWKAAGHPGRGHIVLMLHTFVSDSDTLVRDVVREPLKNYLRTSIELIKPFAESFPTFSTRPAEQSLSQAFASLSREDYDALVEHSFERYFESGGLFGTPERCLDLTGKVKAAGVDEVACLIDFGVAADVVLANLRHLNDLRERANQASDSAGYSIPSMMAAHHVTHLQCTPSMAKMLLADDETREALRPLQALFVGGEALSPSLAAELRQTVTGEVWNMYGPTETTVWSTAWRVDSTSPTVSIGRPIANTQTYVLDAALEPVPIGLPGDLFIGGAGVARGYWGRPDLTADRFQPNPFVSKNGRRMYRTGDVARQRGDGSLEFLGRSDHQVKIRGHRIELGEIEAALATHPAVHEVVVVAREDTPDDRRLVAYVVSRMEPSVQPDMLRAYLSGKLPDYMVPSQVMALDAFPLTPNGKLDRRALPEPGRMVAPVRATVAPATDLQRTVASVWQEVLRVARVGTEDNFFDLGGDSLLAAQVLSSLRSRISESVSLTDLFRFPTVRALTDHLAGRIDASSPVSQSLDRARLRQEAGKQRRAARQRPLHAEGDRP